jgi:hypothetical protein
MPANRKAPDVIADAIAYWCVNHLLLWATACFYVTVTVAFLIAVYVLYIVLTIVSAFYALCIAVRNGWRKLNRRRSRH